MCEAARIYWKSCLPESGTNNFWFCKRERKQKSRKYWRIFERIEESEKRRSTKHKSETIFAVAIGSFLQGQIGINADGQSFELVDHNPQMKPSLNDETCIYRRNRSVQ